MILFSLKVVFFFSRNCWWKWDLHLSAIWAPNDTTQSTRNYIYIPIICFSNIVVMANVICCLDYVHRDSFFFFFSSAGNTTFMHHTEFIGRLFCMLLQVSSVNKGNFKETELNIYYSKILYKPFVCLFFSCLADAPAGAIVFLLIA